MAITTMVCILTGILTAGFLGVYFICQWAEIRKAQPQTIFDWLKVNRKEEVEDE